MSEAAVLWTFQVFAVLLGLVIGSFLQVCVVRWPDDRSVITPRSHCPSCQTPIPWWDNLPLISWVLLRGRCRSCKTPIPVTYPLFELLGGLLAWLTFRRFVHGVEDLDLAHGLAFTLYFGFLCLIAVAAFVDFRHMIIPNETSVYAIPVGILGALALEAAGYGGWLAIGWRSSVLGAMLIGGGLGIFAVMWLYIVGSVGLGEGDIKLMAMVGAFLGLWPGALFVLLFGSILGAVVGLASLLVRGRSLHLPFGPSLAITAAMYVLYGDVVIHTFIPGWIQYL